MVNADVVKMLARWNALDMDDVGEIIRRRISSRLDRLGLTPITAAQRAMLPRDTIRNLYRGDGSIPRADTLVEIAKALETTAAYLIGEEAYPTPEDAAEGAAAGHLRKIPVVLDLEWNRFTPRDRLPKGQTIEVRVPGYESSGLFAGRVIDGHANLYYKVGTYVIFADLADAGIGPADHLLVKRERDDALEFTVRMIDKNRRGDPILLPMRYGSRYKDMREVRFDLPGADVDIRGVVVASLWSRERFVAGERLRAFYPPADLEGEVPPFSEPQVMEPESSAGVVAGRPLSERPEDDIGYELRGLKPIK